MYGVMYTYHYVLHVRNMEDVGWEHFCLSSQFSGSTVVSLYSLASVFVVVDMNAVSMASQ